jgi:uncharacterized membrane protein (DUF485 family)
MLGLLYGILGFIGGVVFFLISLVSLASPSAGFRGVGFGIGMLILFPILYGVLGFVMGYIMAIIYNFVAKKTGGIAFEIE